MMVPVIGDNLFLREDVKNLPTMEQRSQFLKESYEFESFKNAQAFLQSNSLNSLNNQNHQGGNLKNKVLSATYGGTFTSISSNTTYIDVTFKKMYLYMVVGFLLLK